MEFKTTPNLRTMTNVAHWDKVMKLFSVTSILFRFIYYYFMENIDIYLLEFFIDINFFSL